MPAQAAEPDEPPELPEIPDAFSARQPTPARSATPTASSLVEPTIAPPPPPPTPPETFAASSGDSELLDIEDFQFGSNGAPHQSESSQSAEESAMSGAQDAEVDSRASSEPDRFGDESEESTDPRLADTADYPLENFGFAGEHDTEATTTEPAPAAGLEATHFDGQVLDTPDDRIELDEPPAIDSTVAGEPEPLIEMATDINLGLTEG